MGSRTSGDDWSVNVRGPHGVEETNDAGKELLSFLSLNEATICNTWFEKKVIHKNTWQRVRSGTASTMQSQDRRTVSDA